MSDAGAVGPAPGRAAGRAAGRRSGAPLATIRGQKDLGLRFTLHQAIKLAQRKIEQQARMTDAQRQIELKLSLLEQSLVHLRNQQQLGAAWSELAREMQGILNHGNGVTALEAELAEP